MKVPASHSILVLVFLPQQSIFTDYASSIWPLESKKPNYGEQVTDSINKAMKGYVTIFCIVLNVSSFTYSFWTVYSSNIPESEVDQKMDEAYTNARLAAIRDFASSSKSSSQSSQSSQSSKNPTIVVNRVSRR